MQTDYQISQDKPWFKFWPEGVPRHLDYPEIPLFKLLSRAAEMWPKNIAFSCGECLLTYSELDMLTNKLAGGLRNLGIQAGDRIMLFLPNSLEWVIGYYGILKAGSTVSTANPLYRQAELRHQLKDTEATAIVTNENLYPLVKEVQAETKLETIIIE